MVVLNIIRKFAPKEAKHFFASVSKTIKGLGGGDSFFVCFMHH